MKTIPEIQGFIIYFRTNFKTQYDYKFDERKSWWSAINIFWGL